jgi:hypothetical protein
LVGLHTEVRRRFGWHTCFCAAHHAFEHDPCLIIPFTIAPPTAYAGFAISENRKEDECEDKADYDVHGIF